MTGDRRQQKLGRVTIASRIFPPDPGAASHRWLAWTRGVSPFANNVDVLTTLPAIPEPVVFPENVTTRRWPVLRDKDGSVRGYLQYFSFDAPLFFRLLLAPRPNVVLCEPPPTTGAVTRVACSIRRVPYVYCAADLLSEAAVNNGLHGMLLKMLTRLERFALEGAQEVVAVSDTVARKIRDLAGREATVIRHAVESASPTSEAPPGFPVDCGPVFLYAGTVADWMGSDLFIDAAPHVLQHFPEARIIFMGQGTGWERITSHIDSLGDPRVSWRPACPPGEARLWEAKADVCLAALAPGQYQFAYTTKVLTALAAGTPVVYAGVGPAADELVANNLGAVAPLDQAAVAEAMIHVAESVLIRDPETDPERLREWVRDTHGIKTATKLLVETLYRAISEYR